MFVCTREPNDPRDCLDADVGKAGRIQQSSQFCGMPERVLVSLRTRAPCPRCTSSASEASCVAELVSIAVKTLAPAHPPGAGHAASPVAPLADRRRPAAQLTEHDPELAVIERKRGGAGEHRASHVPSVTRPPSKYARSGYPCDGASAAGAIQGSLGRAASARVFEANRPRQRHRRNGAARTAPARRPRAATAPDRRSCRGLAATGPNLQIYPRE